MSIGNRNYNVIDSVASADRIEAVRSSVGLCRDIVFAAALNVSKQTIYRLTRKGMPTLRIGGRRWVNPEVAAAWLAANEQPGPGRPSSRKGIPRRKSTRKSESTAPAPAP